MEKIVKRADGSLRCVWENPNPEKQAQQQFKDECDINKIMEKYHKGEAITHLNTRQGVYGDFSQVRDFRTAVETVIQAEKAFMALPSKVRKRFNNDPQEVMEFISDKSNYEEAVKLGLIDKVQEPINANVDLNRDAKNVPETVEKKH